MPKQSKLSSTRSSSPGVASPVKEEPSKYCCTRCTRSFKKQKSNFPASQSPMFKENNGYLPVCRSCIDEMFMHYKDVLGDEKAAIRRICMKFDIYWHTRIYDMISKASTSGSRVLGYISKANLVPYTGKTFDDTLDEEEREIAIVPTNTAISDAQEYTEDGEAIASEVIEFWGAGFAPSYYIELERRFKYWCGDEDRNAMDVSDCAVIRQICMLEVTITRDTALGKPTDKAVNTLNTLLGSANLKPVQKKKDEGIDAAAESTPFGVWIRKIENTRPISEPEPEFEDVDGVVRYISVWFFGHICKVLKIDNTFSRMYEEEMARLRVERPEYEGEDEEAIFEDIFERAAEKDRDSGDFYG